MHLQFTPWRKFSAIRDRALTLNWLARSATTTHALFAARMQASRGGRLYTHELRTIRGRVVPVGPRGRPHRASAPGDFAAVDSGKLRGSIREVVTQQQFEIGTNTHYAKYLFGGTKRMKKRRMSKEALLEAKARFGPVGAFAKFRLGGPSP